MRKDKLVLGKKYSFGTNEKWIYAGDNVYEGPEAREKIIATFLRKEKYGNEEVILFRQIPMDALELTGDLINTKNWWDYGTRSLNKKPEEFSRLLKILEELPKAA